MVTDLFGVAPAQLPIRPGGTRATKAYAALPGTGPKGSTCGDCAHSYKRRHTQRSYWKCALVAATNGPGTDIRLKTPACSMFKPTEGEER